MIDDITQYIFIQDEPQQADILFLPGGSFPEIPERAAQLYRDGYVPLVLPAGGVGATMGRFGGVKSKRDLYNQDYQTECEFFTDVLIKNGVPKEAILGEYRSGFTKENALFSRQITDAHGLTINKAIICCKSFHARRCFMAYQLAYPEAELFVVPVDCYGISRDNWFNQQYGIERVLGELTRCGNQFTDDLKIFMNCRL
jgi:uncharacterized SAM-binding protein YcdF (DUF218 family)